MYALSEMNRDRYMVAEAIELAHIEDPLQAFEHAWKEVAAGKVKAAELVTLTSTYPSQTVNVVSSPLFEYRQAVPVDSPESVQLNEALQAFVEDVSANKGEYERLNYRFTRSLQSDYIRSELYYDLRAWVAPTTNPRIIMGIQSATDDRGELSRRFFIAKKPLSLQELFTRGLVFLGDVVSAPGINTGFWQ